MDAIAPSFQQPNRHERQRSLFCAGRVRMMLDRYPEPTSPLTVIILHGAGAHSLWFANDALALQQAGYEVLVPNLPGYGPLKAKAHEVDHAHWEHCVAALVTQEAERSGRPCVLIGCSLGGFLAYQVACRCDQVVGLVATLLGNPQLAEVRRAYGRFPWLSHPLVTACLPFFSRVLPVSLPVRWLANMPKISNDPALTRRLIADPLGGGRWLPLRFIASLLDARPRIAPAQFDRCPVLVVHPEQDRWTVPALSHLMFDLLPVRKAFVLLPDCGHFPVEPSGVAVMQAAILAFLVDLQPK